MKADENGLPLSNQTQAIPQRLSKRELETPKRGTDTLYARLRRLEQRVVNLEAGLSTTRRDVFRIEKKIQRADSLPSLKDVEPGTPAREKIPSGLFN